MFREHELRCGKCPGEGGGGRGRQVYDQIDVVRQPRSVRRAFTEGLRSRVAALQRLLPGQSAAARQEKALATMAGLIGALMLSRAVDDPKLSDQILKAATVTFGRP